MIQKKIIQKSASPQNIIVYESNGSNRNIFNFYPKRLKTRRPFLQQMIPRLTLESIGEENRSSFHI